MKGKVPQLQKQHKVQVPVKTQSRFESGKLKHKQQLMAQNRKVEIEEAEAEDSEEDRDEDDAAEDDNDDDEEDDEEDEEEEDDDEEAMELRFGLAFFFLSFLSHHCCGSIGS